jgi:very-short-patch-repair endonuclease
MARFIRYRKSLTPRARLLRHGGTPAERKLWYEFLRERPEKFTRQKPLGSYVADFYCSRHKLVVELDGDSHFIERAQQYDSMRTEALRVLGIRVIRFTNVEIMDSFEGVCMEIQRVLEAA